MLAAIADTHTVIWYLYDDPRLSAIARVVLTEAVERGNQIGMSAISLAEIVYLSEKGRINSQVFARLLAALDLSDALLVELPFDRGIAVRLPDIDRAQVPDLPDRIIAATARSRGLPLITRDHKIRVSGLPTIW